MIDWNVVTTAFACGIGMLIGYVVGYVKGIIKE